MPVRGGGYNQRYNIKPNQIVWLPYDHDEVGVPDEDEYEAAAEGERLEYDDEYDDADAGDSDDDPGMIR